MTDDIVTRLRAAHEQSAKYPRLLLGELEALNEAADEIEQLRKERDYYREMCSIIADKNFVANEEIYSLQYQLKQINTDRNPTK
jgi:uncharacterized coiled-coil DUF342 family protein